jgi:hypothetical protein
MRKKNSLITPPVENDTSGCPYLQCEKYHSQGQHDATVECRRQNIVVTHPPSEVEAANAIIEDETDEEPRYVVNS